MKKRQFLTVSRYLIPPGKTWLGIKLCLVFCMALHMQLLAGVDGQSNKVSLTLHDVGIEDFIGILKEKTGLSFFYHSEIFRGADRINLDVKDAPVSEILDMALRDKGFVFDFADDVVVIKRDPNLSVFPQKHYRLITGKVFDQKLHPCPGVSVIIKGTRTGVATDSDGNFEIRVIDDPDLVLQFSFIGMKTQEVRIGKNSRLKVVLETDTKRLDEVIITGYQTLSKERATGSFGIISPKSLETKLQSNLSSLLEGQACGVVLDKEGRIEIRGVSTFNAESKPLVVLDGYPVEGGLESINPDNIENITILKDGVAASIYGSRAANGVIVVTTARGKEDGFQISYKGVVSTVLKPRLSKLNRASTSDYIDAELDLFNQNPNAPSTMDKWPMGKVTWLMMQVREGNLSDGEAMAEIDELRKVDGLKQAEKAFYRNKFSHQHNLSINGGNERNRFNAALNYTYTQENMVHTDNSRLIFDMKNDWKPNDYISFGLMANVVFYQEDKPEKDWTDLLSYANGALIQPYDSLYDLQTGEPTDVFSTSMYKIANYEKVPGMKDWTYNPIEDLGLSMDRKENLQTRIGGTLRVRLIDGLEVEAGGIWTKGNEVLKTVYDKNAYEIRVQYNDATSKTNYASHYFPDGSMIDEWRNINESWTVRTQINYKKTFRHDLHRINFLAGNEVRKITYSNNQFATRLGYNSTAGTFVPINMIDWNSGVNERDMLMGETMFWTLQTGKYNLMDNRFVSWYGNGSYEYDDRYLVSGSVRLDLTNFFGTDSKYRYKPLWSLGATWKLAQEKFFNVPFVDRLNLRASYGINGNISLQEGPFLILAAGRYLQMTGGVSYGVASPPNDQLRWEKTETSNFGLDLSVFDSRLNLSLDYYLKNSSDLLAKDAIDPTLGFTSLTKNVGRMKNSGFEMALGADLIKGRDFLWNASLNLSYNKNRVKEYNVNRVYASSWVGLPLMAKGYPADAMFGFRYAGLNDKGEAMAYDAEGNKGLIGAMKTEDIIYLGTLRPKYDLSFTNTLKYKDLQLSFMLIAKFGHVYRKDGFYGSNFQNRHVAERWQKPGDEATKMYPKLTEWNNDMFRFPYTDFLTGKANYMKLRDVTLSYTLPKHWLEPVGLTNARVYFQGRNLLTVTAKGVDIDPETAEVNMTGGTSASTEQGFTSLPLRPEFFFGLSFSF